MKRLSAVYEDLTAWAGTGQVVRADADTVAGWRIPENQKAILDNADEHEEETLAELSDLAEELKEIDPPAFDGYLGHTWAEFLERWLW